MYICMQIYVCIYTHAHIYIYIYISILYTYMQMDMCENERRARARAHTAACPGHVDDVGASPCGRTIIQRARGWMAEATRVGAERGRWMLDAGWWMLPVGWRCTRWSISRGRSLNPQLHPHMLAFKPIQRTYGRSARTSLRRSVIRVTCFSTSLTFFLFRVLRFAEYWASWKKRY